MLATAEKRILERPFMCVSYAERQNSATPARGLKPTRDFTANPGSSPALAEVTSLGRAVMSLSTQPRSEGLQEKLPQIPDSEAKEENAGGNSVRCRPMISRVDENSHDSDHPDQPVEHRSKYLEWFHSVCTGLTKKLSHRRRKREH